jgi:hypothetical protein
VIVLNRSCPAVSHYNQNSQYIIEVLYFGTTYNLKFDTLSIKFYRPNLEVDTDRCDERGCPCIIAEAQQKAGFPDTWILLVRVSHGVDVAIVNSPESPMSNSWGILSIVKRYRC